MCMNKALARGFTLIELIFFIVIVSVALVGILRVMDVTVKSTADPMVRKQAVALAESVLQEVLQKAYADPDPASASSQTTRATFNHVDNYNGLSNSTFTDLPSTLSGYVIAIAVTSATLGSVAARKVAVTVTYGANAIVLTGYRTSY